MRPGIFSRMFPRARSALKDKRRVHLMLDHPRITEADTVGRESRTACGHALRAGTKRIWAVRISKTTCETCLRVIARKRKESLNGQTKEPNENS